MKKTIEINVPDGYELSEPQQCTYPSGKPASINIDLLPIEMKGWKWYVTEYLNNFDDRCIKVVLRKDYFTYNSFLALKDYDSIPFEIKIGLLKFICDNHGYNVFDVIYYDSLRKYRDQYKKVYDICPKEFIESLIKNK